MNIAIGSDHAGFELKEEMKKYMTEAGVKFNDLGPYDEKSVDYPDFAVKVCDEVKSGKADRGILICGTGIGMDMAANKVKGIYAALVDNTFTAEMSRKHNNSNVLVLPGRVIGKAMARAIAEKWINTEYDAGRHDQRLDKLKEIENKNFK
jgi:ribose 5-phosphate isomerase B